MAGEPPPLEILPPLLNSASPWATTLDDLRHLYACTSTGAVTTRTSLIHGFDHDPARHQYVFFDAAQEAGRAPNASLNSLGYSPLPLETYLDFIRTIAAEQPPPATPQQQSRKKLFIVSVTGTPEDVARCYSLISAAARDTSSVCPLAMEINLSCPNIPGRPPPAYSEAALTDYLEHLNRAIIEVAGHDDESRPRIPVGLKTPPYTHATEYAALISALRRTATNSPGGVCPISFLTAVNTLGSCLVFADANLNPNSDGDAADYAPALPAASVGGMAGAPLHPLALGNVVTLRRMLDERAAAGLDHVRVVGVGGVLDAAGYRRMRAAGAHAVAVATGLGLKGVGVFGEIEDRLGGRW